MKYNLITNASVEVNGGCNYVCEMCPQSTGREKTFLKKMPLDLYEDICSQLQEAGCKQIDLQGSGEPLLNRNISDYVSIAKQHNLEVSMVSNGFNLSQKISDQLIEVGLDSIRISVIGYNKETYTQWMSRDGIDKVYDNVKYYLQKSRNTNCKISSYHLVLDKETKDYDVQQYKNNWIDPLGIEAEIWLMHNWSGTYDTPYSRNTTKRRSCGRPFAPYINIRAGGLDIHHGAVVPCCYVLGNDSSAVLGHTDTNSIIDIFNSEEYQQLRKFHEQERFDEIDYCKNCDQLYESTESLVWTNIPGKQYGQHKNNQELYFVNG